MCYMCLIFRVFLSWTWLAFVCGISQMFGIHRRLKGIQEFSFFLYQRQNIWNFLFWWIHDSLFFFGGNWKAQAQDMEVLYVETNTFRLASHIYWALWALIQVSKVIDSAHMIFFWDHLGWVPCKRYREWQNLMISTWMQAKVSPIDFDYLGYFFLRYVEYKKQRESCFSLAQSFLSELRNG